MSCIIAYKNIINIENQLFLCMQNKRLYIFNCDCEMAIANGEKFYMPPANVRKMMRDLAYLPAYLGEEGDCVLVEDKEPAIKNNLQVDCKAILSEELLAYSETLSGEPWGLSPKICHWMAERKLGKEWQITQKDWYSRKNTCEVLNYLINANIIADSGIMPQIYNSLGEIAEKVKIGSWLVKAPWSSSGKGLLRLENGISDKTGQWITGVLKKQGYVMLEKFLDKVEDFAMEFKSTDQGVYFIGWSCFFTGEHGEYRGNYVGEQKNIEKRLTTFLGHDLLEQLQIHIPIILQRIFPRYRGFLGVDMMVYRDETRKLQVQPCIEINLRYNMGIIALCLSRKYLDICTEGEFTITFYSRHGEALKEHQRLCIEEPAIYKNNRIKSGYIALTPVSETTQFVASLRCY